MSISSIVGSPILTLPKSSLKPVNVNVNVNGGAVQLTQTRNSSCSYGGCGLVIECSSRPKKKATAHHMKTRPKKSQPWDIRRKPTVYPPLPVLPPDWTLVSSSSSAAAAESNGDGDGDGGDATQVALPSNPALQAAITSG